MDCVRVGFTHGLGSDLDLGVGIGRSSCQSHLMEIGLERSVDLPPSQNMIGACIGYSRGSLSVPLNEAELILGPESHVSAVQLNLWSLKAPDRALPALIVLEESLGVSNRIQQVVRSGGCSILMRVRDGTLGSVGLCKGWVFEASGSGMCACRALDSEPKRDAKDAVSIAFKEPPFRDGKSRSGLMLIAAVSGGVLFVVLILMVRFLLRWRRQNSRYTPERAWSCRCGLEACEGCDSVD
jgi:hypothetical protein